MRVIPRLKNIIIGVKRLVYRLSFDGNMPLLRIENIHNFKKLISIDILA